MWFAHRAVLGEIGLARSLALRVIGLAEALPSARESLAQGVGANIEDRGHLGGAKSVRRLEQKAGGIL